MPDRPTVTVVVADGGIAQQTKMAAARRAVDMLQPRVLDQLHRLMAMRTADVHRERSGVRVQNMGQSQNANNKSLPI